MQCLLYIFCVILLVCVRTSHMYENDILWRVTTETEALKKKESQVSSTVSILLVVIVLFLIIILIIIYRCEIFSLVRYMPPPVAVRHLSMSRRHTTKKRRRGRGITGGEKELDKIIYICVCVCVCWFKCVRAYTWVLRWRNMN